MFTGIVEDVGTIERVEELDGGRRFIVRSRLAGPELEKGASIAIDGACLTVVAPRAQTFAVEAIGTTLSRTVARTYEVGTHVNLERALALGDRLEGHLVQGHVDGVGELLRIRSEGIHHLLDVRIPRSVWDRTILHGSISMNGVSLTVNALERPDRCQVAIIPHTWNQTNLAGLDPGDPVNLEGDLIGKYVGKYVESLPREPGSRSAAEREGENPGESTP